MNNRVLFLTLYMRSVPAINNKYFLEYSYNDGTVVMFYCIQIAKAKINNGVHFTGMQQQQQLDSRVTTVFRHQSAWGLIFVA